MPGLAFPGRRPTLVRARRIGFAVLCLAAGPALGAEKLIATVPGDDFQVGGAGSVQTVTFAADEPVTGIGFTALWTAVVADNENGIAPWSLDLGVTVTAPDGVSQLAWPRLGGDVTIADYPLQDFTGGFDAVDGDGAFSWSFTSIGPNWIAGLQDVQYHLTTQVSDVEQTFEGSVADGPQWSRPYFIAGVSGLGPVVHEALEFEVEVSGGYRIESVVPTGNHFLALYQDGFDPEQPLLNLLDYGIGNGHAANGSPQGASWIDALLFEGRTYHLVASQWASNTPGQPYVTSVIGPGAFVLASGDPIFADGFESGATPD